MTRLGLRLGLVGGLMGFIAAELVVQPLSARFSSATVVWNAASCPSGTYTILSFVRDSTGNLVDSATARNVSLPKATFTQQFSSLPAGSLQVGATAVRDGGGTFTAETQRIQGTGGEGDRFGRTRPSAVPATGFARARTTAPPAPPTEPRSTAPFGVMAQPQDVVLHRLLRQLNVPLDAGDAATWRQFLVEDSDGDGAADVVTIESATGSLFVIRLHIRSPS